MGMLWRLRNWGNMSDTDRRRTVQKPKNITYGPEMVYDLYLNISVFLFLPVLTKRDLQSDVTCVGVGILLVYREWASPWVYHCVQIDCKVTIASSPWQWCAHGDLLIKRSLKNNIPHYGTVSLLGPQRISCGNPDALRLGSSVHK